MSSEFLTPIREDTPDNRAYDEALVALGVMDPASLESGYVPHSHPVRVVTTRLAEDDEEVDPRLLVTDASLHHEGAGVVGEDGVVRDPAHGNRRRVYTAVRHQENLRVTQGRDNWQRGAMHGDITANATSYTGVFGNATSTTSTTLTNTGAAFPTSGGLNGSLQGHMVMAGPNNSGVGATVFGVIVSNTATALTVDQWYDPVSATGAAGTTPNGTCNYQITRAMGPTNQVGLSTSTSSPAAGDVLRSADGLFGDGTTSGTATEQTTNGLSRVYIPPTFPTAGQTQLQYTFTYTGSTPVTIAKVVLCNSKATAGSLLELETLLSSTATVSASGDTLQVTWQENL